MAAPRRFDHDEARRRHESGETLVAIAADMGVTDRAIWWIVKPERRAIGVENARRWRTGTCEVCGGPAMRLVMGKARQNPDGRCLCRRCRSNERRERLLFSDHGELIAVRCAMLDCANGERWQPPAHFPRGTKFRNVREGGIHSQCRACQTRARQDYRERNKVPCEICGALCLPPSEKRTNGSDRPRCRDCFVAARRNAKPAPVSAADPSPHKERAQSVA